MLQRAVQRKNIEAVDLLLSKMSLKGDHVFKFRKCIGFKDSNINRSEKNIADAIVKAINLKPSYVELKQIIKPSLHLTGINAMIGLVLILAILI